MNVDAEGIHNLCASIVDVQCASKMGPVSDDEMIERSQFFCDEDVEFAPKNVVGFYFILLLFLLFFIYIIV